MRKLLDWDEGGPGRSGPAFFKGPGGGFGGLRQARAFQAAPAQYRQVIRFAMTAYQIEGGLAQDDRLRGVRGERTGQVQNTRIIADGMQRGDPHVYRTGGIRRHGPAHLQR